MNARSFICFDKSFTIQPNLLRQYSDCNEYYTQADADKQVRMLNRWKLLGNSIEGFVKCHFSPLSLQRTQNLSCFINQLSRRTQCSLW